MKRAKDVAQWAEHPEASKVATLGARMMAGQWTSREDARAIGAVDSLVTTCTRRLKAAGYAVESKTAGPYGLMAYRVRPSSTSSTSSTRRAKVTAEAAGTTHPQLGAVLTVRALALDEGGNLVVHLSNGHGAAWTAHLTGHVAP